MKRFWFAALLLVVPVAARAQVTVRGTVVDKETGNPVANAIVTVTGTTTAAIASDSGRFVLTSSSGITSLTVTRVGYAPKVVSITNVGAALRVEMTVETVELPGVHIVASNPAPSTAVLSQSDLNRASGLSLVDAINTIPGVFMQSRTPYGGAHINIRGYYPSVSGNSPNSNGEGYSVFLNNIPITDATGTTVMDDIDFSTLGKVEVIKGPASSQYGAFIGGAVNLQTARPTPNQTSALQEVLGGGDGILRTNSTLMGASENSDYVVNYGFQTDTSWRPHSQSQKTYVRASGDFGVAANQTVSAYFSYNRSLEDLAGEIDSVDFYARRPATDSFYVSNNSHIQITSWFTGATDNFRINDHFTNATTVFVGSRFTDQPIAHGFTDATQLNGGGRTQFGYTGQLGDATVSGLLGGMMQRSNVTSAGANIAHTAPFAETPSTTENFAQNAYLFSEWTFGLPSQITVTGGGTLIYDKWQVHNLLVAQKIADTIPPTQWLTKDFKPTFAPRLAVTKGLGSAGSLYASWSTGFTPPLLNSITASNGTTNTDLKPERATQYEVGAQGTLFSRLGGQVSLFDIDNTNKLIQQSVGGVTSTTNVGHQRNRGAELSASFLAVSDPNAALSTLRPWVSYTYTDAKYLSYFSDNNHNAATVNFSGNAVARIPKTMYSAGIDAASHSGVYFNSTYNFVGRVPVTFDNSTWVHSYNLLGAKVGYRNTISHRWLLNAYVGGDNLTNQTYYTFLFVGPNYAGLAQTQDGGSGDGYILPGNPNHVFYAGVNLSYVIK